MKTKLLQLANLADRNAKRLALAAGASVATMPAFAAIDTASIVTDITALIVNVTAIGMALLSVYVVVKGFQMIKGATKGG